MIKKHSNKLLLFIILICTHLLGTKAVFAGETWLWPIAGSNGSNLSRGFDPSINHYGIDICYPGIEGHDIRAAKSGTVVQSSNDCPHYNQYAITGDEDYRHYCNGGCGNFVTIDHGDGTRSRYLHMQQGSAIANGTVVNRGDIIGKVGSSGQSSGPHCHFDIFVNGERINNNPGAISYDYSEPSDVPNPIYERSYWGSMSSTNIRPVVQIRNPETVEKVRFAVWTTEKQTDIKWVTANYNGYGSYFSDIDTSGFVNSGYNCHVYIKGKNGSERSYILTVGYPDPVYQISYWGAQTDTTRRPVIAFRNPEMVEEVKFAVWTTSNQSDLKWFKAYSNGYGSWFYDFNISDFTNSDYMCHAYVTGTNGNVRAYILTLNMSDPECKNSYWVKLTDTTIRPVAEFSNPDMVEKIRFAIWTTSNQSDIKWVDAYSNGYGSWFYDFDISEFTNRVFTCHIYIKGTNGSERSIAMSERLDLDKNTYSITYHLDGGENAAGNPTEYTDNEILNLQDPLKEHYTFKGWYLSEAGDVPFENGTAYNKDLDVYARWEKTKYVITLFVNHEVEPGSESSVKYVTYGDPIGELPVPEWEDHTFTGWFTAEEGGTQITAEDIYTDGTYYYAHWVQNPVHITFDGNEVFALSLEEYARDKTPGEAYGVLPEVSAQGYDFLGWFTQKVDGSEITPDTAVTLTKDHTIYAHWVAKEYSLNFESNLDGVDNPVSRKIKYKKTFGELPVISSDGYDFLGWFDAADGTRRFTSTSVYTYTSDITLHAKWEKQEEPHTHTYEEQVTTEPTCTEPGVRTFTCSGCNDSYTEEIPATGHTAETERTGVKEATCTEDGYTGDILCHNCGAVLEKGTVITAPGHRTTIRDAKEASCSENGYTGDTWCIVCENKVSEGEIINAPGHDWVAGDIKKEVTCTEAGEQEYTCSRCGETTTESIPTTGHLGEQILRFVKAVTCTENGYTGDIYCNKCYELIQEGEEIPATGHQHTVVRNKKEATCSQEGYTGDTYCLVCEELAEEGSVIPKADHAWDQGTVTKEATATEEGIKTYTCTNCEEKKEEKIPATGETKPTKTTETDKPADPKPQEPVQPQTTETDLWGNILVPEEQMEKTVLSLTNDNDPAGSSFSLLQAGAKKVTKTTITVIWKKVPGATSYTVYGNKCGKGNRYQKLATVTGGKYVYKSLKRGTYYKLMIVANGGGKARAVSKTLHLATTGGKVGNNKFIKVTSKKNVILKNGKTSKIKAKAIAKSSKQKVKKHRDLAFETDNPKVATVNKSGKIKAVGKGTCTIYVYAQDGTFAKVKVKVN